ncbi:hypothetical protein SYNPS1DRAFT_21406 [Syncephalis pseudoplumigaleata]|uniref:Uncharacterized protein n=1 Tax=Syncephalis pseudoplumigaleata TaxID=1712513 RepID=A0A4P9Z5N4_9FUNG|nr:hypothetical protein SYNPS1DRAFT_21406 [Syncephalis pseudoplumigaleata]|eukprot:RKP26940.1 hypothetical protein SYNPS1DRAFT_21406 [Syncephalis pseudoplumigaleata]
MPIKLRNFPDTSNQELFISTSVTFTTYKSAAKCNQSMHALPATLPGDDKLPLNVTTANLVTDLRNTAECIYSNGMKRSAHHFIGNVDDYEIALDHTVRDQITGQFYHSRRLEGALAAYNSPIDRPNALLHFGASSNKLPLSTLLEAANLTLNEETRTNGVVLVVYIDYRNRYNLYAPVDRPITYTYRVEAVAGMSTERVEVKPIEREMVTEVARKGIRVIFRQAGLLGHFNVIALLKYLCIALLLGAISKMLLEIVMLYVLPQRYLYHARKYELCSTAKPPRPREVAAPEDDASFYTAHQSAMLASAMALNGGMSPTHPHRLSLLRVVNRTDRSLDSSLSSRSVSEPQRRTSSLPAASRPARSDLVLSDPPSYFSRSVQSPAKRPSMDRLTENTDEDNRTAASSKAQDALSVACASSEGEDDRSMVSIALDGPISLPMQPTNTQHSDLAGSAAATAADSSVHRANTTRTTSTLPHQPAGAGAGAGAPHATRAYRYEPESSRASWTTSTTPMTPYTAAKHGRPDAAKTDSATSHVITSFIQESNMPSMSAASPPFLSDNTIMSYVSANGTQMSIPRVVVENTESEGDIIPSVLASFNAPRNKSIDTGYMAADDSADQRMEEEAAASVQLYREGILTTGESSNEPVSEYESRDDSAGTDTTTIRILNQSGSDSDAYMTSILRAMELFGSDPSYTMEHV